MQNNTPTMGSCVFTSCGYQLDPLNVRNTVLAGEVCLDNGTSPPGNPCANSMPMMQGAMANPMRAPMMCNTAANPMRMPMLQSGPRMQNKSCMQARAAMPSPPGAMCMQADMGSAPMMQDAMDKSCLLATAYIKAQMYVAGYTPEETLVQGTFFPELVRP